MKIQDIGILLVIELVNISSGDGNGARLR